MLSDDISCPLLDPFQLAYRQPKRSVEHAVSLGLHYALQHIEISNRHERVLFIDFNSVFNTLLPFKLVEKLQRISVVYTINLLDTGL